MPTPGTVIALENHKGGVAKSTTTANVAAALAERGHKVLAIDADAQGSLSASFGIARADRAPCLSQALLHQRPLAALVRETQVPRVHLVTGSIGLLMADVHLAFHDDRMQRLTRALDPVRSSYDYVVLDLPPSLGLVSINGLVAADHYVVPVAPGYLDMDGLVGMLEVVDHLQLMGAVAGRVAHLAGYLLTRVDYGRGLGVREMVETLRARAGTNVFAQEVNQSRHVAEAPGAGVPCVVRFPRSPGAEQYQAVTTELLKRIGAA